MSDERPIPLGGDTLGGGLNPNKTPYDLTKDPIWRKGVAKRVDVRRPEKQYREAELCQES